MQGCWALPIMFRVVDSPVANTHHPAFEAQRPKQLSRVGVVIPCMEDVIFSHTQFRTDRRRACRRGAIGSTMGAYPRDTGSNPVEGNGHFFPSHRQLYLSSFFLSFVFLFLFVSLSSLSFVFRHTHTHFVTCVHIHVHTAWCSETGSLTSLEAQNSGASIDAREPAPGSTPWGSDRLTWLIN